MAVSNTLAKKRTEAFQNVQSASYEVGGMKIELTPEIVKQYMVSGSIHREVFLPLLRIWSLSTQGMEKRDCSPG